MLSLGLNIWRCISSGGAFNPASLFANGELGLWYDPSDISTAYQDSAGTTPGAIGAPVGKRLDKSGRSNHIYQSTSSARPILSSTSGVFYDTFDGIDDFTVTSTITLGSDMDFFIALRRNTSASLIVSAGSPHSSAYLLVLQNNAANLNLDVGAPVPYVNGVVVPGGAAATRGQANTACPPGAWLIIEMHNCDFSSANWSALGVINFPSFDPNVDVAGMLICPAGDTTQRQQIRTYLGAKVGLTL